MGEIKAVVIVKDLDDRRIVVGELPGPYPSDEAAVADLVAGQEYIVRDGILYAQEMVERPEEMKSRLLRLIVTGPPQEAAAAAAKRGIKVRRSVRYTGAPGWAILSVHHSHIAQVREWFGETPAIPFPVGTLLYY